MGVWLPLALADLLAAAHAVARRAGGDCGEIRLPKRSEILKAWALPVMAEALAEDEQEQEAFEMLKSVQRLGGEVK